MNTISLFVNAENSLWTTSGARHERCMAGFYDNAVTNLPVYRRRCGWRRLDMRVAAGKRIEHVFTEMVIGRISQ